MEKKQVQSGHFFYGFEALDMLHNLSPETCHSVHHVKPSSSQSLCLSAKGTTVHSNVCIHVHSLYICLI